MALTAMSTFLLTILNLILAASSSSLNVLVPPQTRECLILDKQEGDMLYVNIRIASAGPGQVHLIMYDPSMKVAFAESGLLSKEVKQRVTTSGAYTFCFDNFDQFVKYRVIRFDYDLHINEEKTSFAKRLDEEEKNFLRKLTLRETEKLLEEAKRAGTLTDEDTKRYLETHKKDMEGALFIDGEREDFISIVRSFTKINFHIQSVRYYLGQLKSELRRHHEVIEDQLTYVDRNSLMACIGMLIVGYLQVVIVRSFFNRKISLNVWAKSSST